MKDESNWELAKAHNRSHAMAMVVAKWVYCAAAIVLELLWPAILFDLQRGYYYIKAT